MSRTYGSVARSRETENSDVDLMIVGRVHFDEVVASLARAEKSLNREVNPTVYSIREFGKKVRGNFLKTVLADKKLFIIGDEDDLRELGQNSWLEERASDREEIGRLLTLAVGPLHQGVRAGCIGRDEEPRNAVGRVDESAAIVEQVN